MARRRSVYRVPKLKLRQKTITAIGSLVAFALSILSVVTLATDSQTLSFWRKILVELFGWTKIFSPLIFLLSGLVLSRLRWRFAQTNVLLGLILIMLALASLTTPLRSDQAGALGQTIWLQLASFVTEIGAASLLAIVFLVGVVVLFNTSLGQIFAIFGWIFSTVSKLIKPIFNRQRTFEAKHIPIKVSGVDERALPKAPPTPTKEPVLADTLVQNVAGKTQVWKYPPLSTLSEKAGTPAD